MARFVCLVSFLVLVAGAGNNTAAAGNDLFAAASARATFPALEPSAIPAGFALAGVELLGNPPDTLVATYHAPDGRSLFLMEGDPDGLTCPECRETTVGTRKASYRVDQAEDGSRLLSLVFVMDRAGISVGLRDDGSASEADALSILREFAASLQPVVAAAARQKDPLEEAARQASFPVYAPSWLPQYFTLKSVTYTPAPDTTSTDQGLDEQVTLVYEDPVKTISLAVRGAGRVKLPSGPGTRKLSAGGWPAAIQETEGRRLLVVSTGDASIVLTGTVQEDTLIRVARSLRRVQTEAQPSTR
ncbi:MAG: hypothetical protein KatS3mg024_0695 [Armatimonadota bacterium]|nr:MAG: hypothetical protein KatS3mg024_0695 [Armatimonadota bacterium]